MLALAVGVIAVLLIANRIRAYRRLSHIPGPKLAGWSRIWMAWANSSGENHEHLYNVTLKYGSIARIGPNHLLTSEPELIRRMQAARSPYRRSLFYSTFRFKPRHDNIVSEVNEVRHEALRKKMSAGYSGKEVPHLEEDMNEQLGILISAIRERYISTNKELKPMDIGRQIQYWTLDVISSIAFGSPFGDVPADEDKFQYIGITEQAISAMSLFTVFPHVHRFIENSRIVDLLAPTAKDKTGLGRVIGIVADKIAERFKGGVLQDKMDMTGSFLRHGLTREEAESEAMLQIMAGSDTTATAIRVTLLHVITSPLMMNKLRAEIDNAMANGKMSSPISNAEALELPYLQACIRESLRLWPPITGILQKVVPPGGDTFNGVFIPGGTLVGQCAWALGRNPDIFGQDCTLFRPERWLEASGPELQRMDRQADLTFGYGRFGCLGKPVALMELNKAVVELLRNFDISVIHPYKPWSSDSRGIFLQKNFWVRVAERAT